MGDFEIPVADDIPLISLTYQLNDSNPDNYIASFVMAVGIPDGVEVKEMGTAIKYAMITSKNPQIIKLAILVVL